MDYLKNPYFFEEPGGVSSSVSAKREYFMDRCHSLQKDGRINPRESILLFAYTYGFISCSDFIIYGMGGMTRRNCCAYLSRYAHDGFLFPLQLNYVPANDERVFILSGKGLEFLSGRYPLDRERYQLLLRRASVLDKSGSYRLCNHDYYGASTCQQLAAAAKSMGFDAEIALESYAGDKASSSRIRASARPNMRDIARPDGIVRLGLGACSHTLLVEQDMRSEPVVQLMSWIQ